MSLKSYHSLILAIVLISAPAAYPQTWDNDAGTSLWNTGTNWSGNAVPSSGANVTFSSAGVGTINLDTAPTVGYLVFDSVSGTYILTNLTLTINTGISNQSTSSLQTFNNNITLNGNNTWYDAGGGMTFNGSINGQSLNETYLNGPGTITWAGGASNLRHTYVRTGSTLVLTNSNASWTAGHSIQMDSANSTFKILSNAVGTVSSVHTYVGQNSGNTNNTFVVSGTGARWSGSHGIRLGENAGADNNQLIISNNGVFDGGTTDQIYIGNAGNGNKLVIDNGRLSGGQLIAGRNSHNNSIIISNNGVVSNVSFVRLSEQGASTNNRVIITSGGKMTNTAGEVRIGEGNGAQFNTVLVSGSGSVWHAGDQLIVGYGSPSYNNTLTVSNNAIFRAGNLVRLGQQGASTNNWIYVLDGSKFTNTAGEVRLGEGTGANNNGILVSGSNSSWYSGADISLGYGDSSSNNYITVTGSNVTMQASGQLNVGFRAGTSSNMMVISNGAKVYSGGDSAVGRYDGASNNTMIVDGATLNTTNDFRIGNSAVANGNLLLIRNGGVMTNTASFYIGDNGTSSSNTAVVSGIDSILRNNGQFNVGQGGQYNQLIVSNGGLMSGGGAVRIGANGSAGNNTITVWGSGSRMTNTGSITIGESGTGNRLVVSNGGYVRAGDTLDIRSGNSLVHDGGTIRTDKIAINNASTVQVGNGTQRATFQLDNIAGSTFNTRKLNINSNAVFAIGGAQSVTLANLVANNIITNVGSGFGGTGTLTGDFTYANGSTVAPGNSPGTFTQVGTVTFGGAGNYDFEVNSFGGTAGADPGWDLFNVTGTLDITATSGNKFNINLLSLTTNNVSGVVWDFSSLSNSTNKIASATTSISNFAANKFNINTSGFSNSFVGSWSVGQTGTNLFLYYLAITPDVYVWTGGGGASSNWNDSANWDTGIVPANDGSKQIVFAGVAATTTNPVTTTAYNIRSLMFSNLGGMGSYTLEGQNITIQGTNGVGIWQSNSAAQTISNSLTLATNQVWVAAGDLKLGGAVNVSSNTLGLTGASNFIFIAGGDLKANGGLVTNTSNGLIFTNGGQANLTNSTLRATAGTITVTNGGAINLATGTVQNANVMNVQGSGISGNGALRNLSGNSVVTGAVALTGNATVGVDAGALTLSNTLSGAGALTKVGAGTMVLVGANTYSGGTTISNGTVSLSGSARINHASADMIVGGNNASLIITNGAAVSNRIGYIGYGPSDNSNSVLVSGAGSLWNNSSNVWIGYSGSVNTLTIRNGGRVNAKNLYLDADLSVSNLLVVDGGTQAVDGDLYVGDNGDFNTMIVSNGGVVWSTNGYIGYQSTGSNNSCLLYTSDAADE